MKGVFYLPGIFNKKSIIVTCLIIIGGLFIFFFSSSKLPFGNNKSVLKSSNYIFIYSYVFGKNTYLYTAKQGETKAEKFKYNVKDIRSINYYNDEILLATETINNPRNYIINDSMNLIKKEKAKAPSTFFIEDNQIKLEGFNVNVEKNTLRVTDKAYKKNYDITFPTYLAYSKYDKDYIYVCNDDVKNTLHLFHIIDRKTGELIRTEKIENTFKDIYIADDKVLLATQGDNLTVIHKNDWRQEKIKYPFQSEYIDKIHIENNKIYILYFNSTGSYLSILDLKYKLIENKMIVGENDRYIKSEDVFVKSIFKNNKLHILFDHQDNSAKYGATFQVYNLETLKKEHQLLLPKEDIRISDFIIK
ncbi:hypothetical protein [Bacillus wiedmannii]|uniref:hypothetical protein n=1 Tax=Bacillus wiedmannii TaxID=1890302 RepID=UPI001C3F352F|nr:hypothetical protein [Bacillus wiedmannii]